VSPVQFSEWLDRSIDAQFVEKHNDFVVEIKRDSSSCFEFLLQSGNRIKSKKLSFVLGRMQSFLKIIFPMK